MGKQKKDNEGEELRNGDHDTELLRKEAEKKCKKKKKRLL